MKGSKEVHSLTRGLAVLDELNREGAARAGSLARRLRLARPTVYRLLDTLEESGYVAKSASDERYRITQRTAQLFKRYSTALDGASTDLLQTAAEQSGWLLHLSTFDGSSMVVRLTGWPIVPALPCRGYTGRTLPILSSSAGHAYLAACDDVQASEVAATLQSVDEISVLGRVRTEVSAGGYAVSADSEAGISNLSVGVARAGRARGALTAVVLQTLLDNDGAKQHLVDSLIRLSSEIGVQA